VQRFCLAIVVACSAVFLAVAGPARADSNDQQYLALLKTAGLSCEQAVFDCPQGDDSMISFGHQICRQLHAGNSARSLGSLIVRSRPSVQPDQAVKLVVASQTAYCPQD
jgi:hypothetical protein